MVEAPGNASRLRGALEDLDSRNDQVVAKVPGAVFLGPLVAAHDVVRVHLADLRHESHGRLVGELGEQCGPAQGRHSVIPPSTSRMAPLMWSFSIRPQTASRNGLRLAELAHGDLAADLLAQVFRYALGHGRLDEAGRHGVDTHAARPELHGELTGQCLQSRLRGAVDGASDESAARQHARDVDDGSRPRARHFMAEHLHEEQRSLQVDRDQVIEAGLLDLERGLVRPIVPGVVDENERRAAGDRLAEEAFPAGGGRQVRLQKKRPGKLGGQGLGGRAVRVVVEPDQDRSLATLVELAGDGPPDAAGSSRNDCDVHRQAGRASIRPPPQASPAPTTAYRIRSPGRKRSQFWAMTDGQPAPAMLP